MDCKITITLVIKQNMAYILNMCIDMINNSIQNKNENDQTKWKIF